MNKRAAIALCLSLMSCHQSPTAVARKTPAIPLAGRVTDLAGTMTPEQQSALAGKLRKFEQETKHQMVVATVTSLGNQDIQTYTKDLFNAWGVGRKSYNDGVVVLIAPTQHQARITVGSGIESVLTDSVCADIMRDKMIPKLKTGNYYEGVDAGVDALIEKLK